MLIATMVLSVRAGWLISLMTALLLGMTVAERDTTLKELNTLQWLAKAASVSYRTVHRYAKMGRIKTVRLGGSVRVPRKECERILTRGF